MKRGTIKKNLFRVAVISVVAIIGLVGCKSTSDSSTTDNLGQVEVNQTMGPQPRETIPKITYSAPTQPVTTQPEQTQPPITQYKSGTYKVGVDIPAGEYILMGPGYFSVTSDSSGDSILFNENFEFNSIVTVLDGEYLKLSKCIACPFLEYNSRYSLDTTKSGSMLKVGTHIPAGEYKLQADEDNGYYAVYNDSRHQDIVTNEYFENSTYITVKDGQYLKFSSCKISN